MLEEDTTSQRILLVGLPETGKSSYVQAVDEALKHPPTSDDLCEYGLAPDRSYIHGIKEDFLSGRTLGRTDYKKTDTAVELWFEHPPTNMRGRLYLPDEKGELFSDQWKYRRWDQNYRDGLAEISGIIIFLRADGKARNDELIGALIGNVQTGTPRKWDMQHASAQVQLVDILQFIVEHDDTPNPLRTAVVISAWDTVGSLGDNRPKHPERFLEREWALLYQYLDANSESVNYKIYGVSAYGGVPGDLGILAEKPAHERFWITDGLHRTPNLTDPIKWVLQLHNRSNDNEH